MRLKPRGCIQDAPCRIHQFYYPHKPYLPIIPLGYTQRISPDAHMLEINLGLLFITACSRIIILSNRKTAAQNTFLGAKTVLPFFFRIYLVYHQLLPAARFVFVTLMAEATTSRLSPPSYVGGQSPRQASKTALGRANYMYMRTCLSPPREPRRIFHTNTRVSSGQRPTPD